MGLQKSYNFYKPVTQNHQKETFIMEHSRFYIVISVAYISWALH